MILGGSSAGGLAVFTWINYLRKLLPSTIKLWGLSDGGYFVDYKN